MGWNVLSQAKVAVFGVGGVGSYCVEALARAGIGTLILFDSDRIAVSNINRQLIALHSTVGMLKTEVAARRIADINPDCHVIQYPVFFLPENAAQYDLSGCSYIVDAVDTVAAKLSIIQLAMEKDIPVISCMGAGNKLDPTRFEGSGHLPHLGLSIGKGYASGTKKEGDRTLQGGLFPRTGAFSCCARRTAP